MNVRDSRAAPDFHRLDAEVAGLIKGMLLRGDKQQDIGAFFGINHGRVSDINKGYRYAEVEAAAPEALLPPGPHLTPAALWRVRVGLERVHDIISEALNIIHRAEQAAR
jgi:hypothetical protein